MSRFPNVADGDLCPQDAAHGRMFMLSSRRQVCTHSKHRGGYRYEYDGVTPARPSGGMTPAAELLPRRKGAHV